MRCFVTLHSWSCAWQRLQCVWASILSTISNQSWFLSKPLWIPIESERLHYKVFHIQARMDMCIQSVERNRQNISYSSKELHMDDKTNAFISNYFWIIHYSNFSWIQWAFGCVSGNFWLFLSSEFIIRNEIHVDGIGDHTFTTFVAFWSYMTCFACLIQLTNQIFSQLWQEVEHIASSLKANLAVYGYIREQEKLITQTNSFQIISNI